MVSRSAIITRPGTCEQVMTPRATRSRRNSAECVCVEHLVKLIRDDGLQCEAIVDNPFPETADQDLRLVCRSA